MSSFLILLTSLVRVIATPRTMAPQMSWSSESQRECSFLGDCGARWYLQRARNVKPKLAFFHFVNTELDETLFEGSCGNGSVANTLVCSQQNVKTCKRTRQVTKMAEAAKYLYWFLVHRPCYTLNHTAVRHSHNCKRLCGVGNECL